MQETPVKEENSLSVRDFGRGTLQTLPCLVSRRWWWVTLLVILGMAGLVRLGIWQMDRLHQRQAFNAMVADQWSEPPFNLEAEGLPADLKELNYRRVEVDGKPDYAHQMVLTNQSGPNGEAGVILLTPWLMENGQGVIVARGWVPQEYATSDRWPEVAETPDGPIIGMIQESQTIEGAPAPTGFQTDWYRVDLPLIADQMPYAILPAFVLQLPEEGRTIDQLPYRAIPFELSEGNHLSYAIQWVLFAVILGLGYIQYVRWHEMRERRAAEELAAAGQAGVAEGTGSPEDAARIDLEPVPAVAGAAQAVPGAAQAVADPVFPLSEPLETER